jgi:hypothetical protein
MVVSKPSAPRAREVRSSLVLVIDRTLYGVRVLGGESGEDARAFRLNKEDGTLYDVAETRHGPRCDCADFVYRRDGLDPSGCKHVKALVAQGLIHAGAGSDGPRLGR